MGTFGPNGEIDPQRGVIISCLGKKRSGKSVMGMWYFMNYPGDKIVIDVAGDDGPIGRDVHTLVGTVEDLPRKWPEYLRRFDDNGRPLPMILRYVPDAGSDTFLEDMDTVVGMVLEHDQCCILVHEIGVLAEANKTKRHTRRLLMHNRHNGATTAILCGPRAQTVEPLVLQQSDLVYTFEMQGVADRKRIAESIGWNVKDFDTAVHQLGPHEYLLFDANEAKPGPGEEDRRLLHVEALPQDVVVKVERWAKGYRPRKR